ncbi:MAG: NAD(P)/FAD-dependent oxidoreductase [Gammaproteobacteria bacterium]|jgi:flavin-dependent dehydrogenase
MDKYDVIIVGGGPAGSSCAWKLMQHGVNVMLLDAQPFPRLKLCAGWITPEVVTDLRIDTKSYPHSFLTFDSLQIHLRGIHFGLRSVQHSIRRYEFDDWLLRRSGVPVVTHNVRNIHPDGDGYIVDDNWRCRYLVGAGGTKCPVYRDVFREANPRARQLQTVTLEEEFPYSDTRTDCHLWFFEKGFPGYSWYVPKANGWLNVGIGGMASQLKLRQEDIKSHWQVLVDRLRRDGLVRDHEFAPKGYSYYLRDDVQTVRIDNAFLTGDAAGLATRDLCEGIGPAVKSGLMAAEAIVHKHDYSLDAIARYTNDRRLVYRPLEYFFIEREQKRLARAAKIAAPLPHG